METVRLSDLINEGLQAGLTPHQIRVGLAARGVRWSYNYAGQGPGTRERARRLRQAGLTMCPCGRAFKREEAVDMTLCDDCLHAKWAPSNV